MNITSCHLGKPIEKESTNLQHIDLTLWCDIRAYIILYTCILMIAVMMLFYGLAAVFFYPGDLSQLLVDVRKSCFDQGNPLWCHFTKVKWMNYVYFKWRLNVSAHGWKGEKKPSIRGCWLLTSSHIFIFSWLFTVMSLPLMVERTQDFQMVSCHYQLV